MQIQIQTTHRESQSVEHQRIHIPKNPFCEVCQRSRMYRKRTHCKRYDSLNPRGALPNVSKARTEGRNNVEYSGLIRAFTCDQRAVKQSTNTCWLSWDQAIVQSRPL